jgi:hypothetical protein
MVEVDPIYAELNACEETKKYFKRSCRIEELLGDEIREKNTDDAMVAVIDAFQKVLETLPTTEAGLLAKLAFVRKFTEDYPDAVIDGMDILSTLVIAA